MKATLAFIFILMFTSCQYLHIEKTVDKKNQINIVSGSLQTAMVNQLLPQPIVARVSSSEGAPVSGVLVAFTVTQGSGGLTSIVSTSGTDGIVSAQWTLGSVGGIQKVEVSGSGIEPVEFSATATADVPTKLLISASPTLAAGICAAVIFKRVDQHDNPSATVSALALTINPDANGGFYLANDCSGVAMTSVSIDANTSSKTMYYKNNLAGGYSLAADAVGFTQATYSITITGIVSVISFSRDGFTLNESGGVIGTPITLTRTVPGAYQEVTVLIDAISAGSSDLTLGSKTLSFLPGETSITVPSSFFVLVADTAVEGDEFFRMRLSAVTNLGTLGTLTEAKINLLDNALTENFFFSHPLYSAVEGSPSVAIAVQRSGSLSVTSTVTLNPLNGSAVGGTDFNGAPIVITFAPGVSEVITPVTLINTSNPADSKSFYVELKTPSSGSSVRSWGTSKVRIVDEDDTTTCDATNLNLASNGGFGGGAGIMGNPYRICSLAQLYLVRNNLSSYFRLMADLDLDPSLDADPGIAGVQAYTPITGNFSGVFNGDEHVLKNFRHVRSSGSTMPLAMLELIGGSTSVAVRAINLSLVYLVNNYSNYYAGGLAGQTSGAIGSISHNSFSGYVETSGTGSASMILNHSITTMASPLTLNFVHGTVKSGGAAGGVVAAIYNNSSNSDQMKSYSTANVHGGNAVGGLLGTSTPGGFLSSMSTVISSSHAKGLVKTTNDNAGGLVGSSGSNGGCDLTVTDSFSTGRVYGSGNAGGLFGFYSCRQSTCGISNSYATGAVELVSGGSGNRAGGLLGALESDVTMTINNVSASGTTVLTLPASSAGGLIGRVSIYNGTSQTITISNSNASGVVDAGVNDNGAGGFIGTTTLDEGSGMKLNITSSHASGNVLGAPVSYSVGGLFGSVSMRGNGTNNEVNINLSYSASAVSGYRKTGGLIGQIEMNTPNGASINISNSYNTGNITCSSNSAQNTGGIIGDIYNSGGVAASVTVNNTYSSGRVTSNGQFVGGLVGSLYYGGTDYNFTMTGSRATGEVIATNFAGGAFGSMVFDGTNHDVTITSSYATGKVTGTDNTGGFIGLYRSNVGSSGIITLFDRSYATGDVIGQTGTGGFIGSLNSAGISHTHTFTKVRGEGFVSSTGNKTGGIAGQYVCENAGSPSTVMKIEKSLAMGNVESTNYDTGGMVGEMISYHAGCIMTVENSHAQGTVHTIGNGGGIVGSMTAASAGDTVRILNSFTTASSITGASIGGIAVAINGGATLSNSYWLKDGAINTSIADDTRQLTLAQMGVQGNFAGWNFATVWNPPVTGSVPTLR